MEAREDLIADEAAFQKQFIVQDQDGYLFSFCCDSF
jgi:hypothetical protein